MDIRKLGDLFAENVLSRCKGAEDSGRGRTLRAYEVDLSRWVARAAFEIAVGGADGDAVRGRGLADRAAGAAGDLEEAYTRVHQHIEVAVAEQLLVGLAGGDA